MHRLLLPLLSVLLAGSARAAEFENYAVPVYTGALVMPDFEGAQRDRRNFRTRIREGAERQGIMFAGRWSLVFIGCGSGCQFGVGVDLSSGRIIDVPFSDSGYPFMETDIRKDSALFQASWMDGWEEGDPCHAGAWTLEGETFRRIEAGPELAARLCTP